MFDCVLITNLVQSQLNILLVMNTCLILHLLSLNFGNVEIELKSTKKECYFEKKYYKMVDCIRKYFQCLRSLGKKEMFLFIKYTINFRPKNTKRHLMLQIQLVTC